MGGNAFGAILQSTAFPRLPPAVYCGLKARMMSILEDLYMHVGVPREAPEKADYGDLDLIVCLPRQHNTPIQNSLESNSAGDSLVEQVLINLPHDTVAAAIKARYLNPMEGNRTSNFAVPISEGEWSVYGESERKAEERARKDAGKEGIFYQVDVNVCGSKNEWDRRVFFHGYGDLNMILGLITKNAGLHLSHKGLKYPDPPNSPLLLSESFEEILDFFGWSMDVWKSGFETQMACYEWAVTSRFFDPSQFTMRGPLIKKRKPSRTMYAKFIEWAGSLSQDSTTANHKSSHEALDARGAALDFFNKRSVFNERRTAQESKTTQSVFSGYNVRDWTDLGNYWLGVKKIMDEVRKRLGGDDGVTKLVREEGEEKLRRLVIEVQAELGVWPKSKSENAIEPVVNEARETNDAACEGIENMEM